MEPNVFKLDLYLKIVRCEHLTSSATCWGVILSEISNVASCCLGKERPGRISAFFNPGIVESKVGAEDVPRWFEKDDIGERDAKSILIWAEVNWFLQGTVFYPAMKEIT